MKRALVGGGEELLQFCAVLRALADHPGPAGFVGFVVIKLAVGALELDGLNAGVGLAFGVLGVLLRENRHRIRFRLLPRLAQNIALSTVSLSQVDLFTRIDTSAV